MSKNDLVKLNETIKEKMLHLLKKEEHKYIEAINATLIRYDNANQVNCAICDPIIVFMVQGSKETIMGSERIRYGQNQCLLVGIDLPSVSYIKNISAIEPMLSLSMAIDTKIINELLAEVCLPKNEFNSNKALAVIDIDFGLLDAFRRLVDLAEDKKQAKILAPMVIKEIHYRLLLSPIGHSLKMISTYGTNANLISNAVKYIKENYKSNIKIEELAKRANMAQSTFRKYFLKVTTLSPLQYQKRLRLYEARRLMLADGQNANVASYNVGYESQTQFNREYKRMFGEPPQKNIKNIKNNSTLIKK